MKAIILKYFILIISFSVILSSNSVASEKVYTIPLLSECEDVATAFLKKRGIKFEIKKFDINLKSHPNLVGYITLKAINNQKKETLKYMVNTILIDCYPMSEYSFSESQSEIIRKKVDSYNDTGMGPSYITIQNKKVIIHSKGASLNESGRRLYLIDGELKIITESD